MRHEQLVRPIVLTLAVWLDASGLAPAQGGEDWSALDSRLQSFVPGEVNGLTLIVARHGRIIYTRALGNQTPESVLPIASATKMPSGVVIMALVERGLINLDEPVATYLEGKIDWPADKAAVTTRMLFNHTSGVSVDAPCLNNQATTTLKDCAQAIANQPLEFTPPGSRFAYSGSSMQVAGYVAEVVSGKRWNDLFSEILARPLGLTKFTYTETNNPRIAGGASSDVGDYTRILQTVLAGGVWQGQRVLSPATVALMLTDQVAGIPKLRSPGGTTLTGYSFGWWHSDPGFLARQPAPQTRGPELSDQGAFGCTPWIDLGLNYSAILLIRDRTSTGTAIWDQIRPLIVEQINKHTFAANALNAASYAAAALTPEAIVAAFGANLAAGTATAAATPLPTMLGGASIHVRDSGGFDRPAPLFFVSPAQVNFQIPPGTAPGPATVTISNGRDVSTGTVLIVPVAPGLFAADASGRGLAAATALRVKGDGTQSYEEVVRYDPGWGKYVAAPVDLGAPGEQVFLVLYGTGFRFLSGLSGVKALIGGYEAPVVFAGPQGGFVGLDQVNVLLPRDLIGRGEVDILVGIDAQPANPVRVNIR